MPDSPDDDKTLFQPRAPASAGPAPAPAPAADDGPALPIGTRVAEFEITGIVGTGGFGIVYLAQDHSLGRRVALKEYMPGSLARRVAGGQVEVKAPQHAETFKAALRSFVNEAKLLAQFDHPSLVKVYRFWEANGTAYMVMPYYEGRTLRQTLKSMRQPPTEEWLKSLLQEVLNALDVMHAENCFHRDIAPDNIMLLANGRPVLLDFGAARRVIGDRTQALTVILKPGYAPLEQYGDMPDLKQGAYTDLYALAAVVYAAITGTPPGPAVSRLISDTMPPLVAMGHGRYTDDFLRAIDHALAVKPEHRPQTVAEFRKLLWPPQSTTPVRALGESEMRLLGQAGEGLEPAARAALHSKLRDQVVPANALVFSAGDVDRDLMIVQSGHIMLATSWPAQTGLELALMGPGMAFGEVAFLNGMARTAFAGAEGGPVELMRLSRADFDAWALDYPRDALVFMGNLAQMGTWRLGATTQQLRAALE
jgi:Protein kinase domain/Cyclic nucleotide-binding domain